MTGKSVGAGGWSHHSKQEIKFGSGNGCHLLLIGAIVPKLPQAPKQSTTKSRQNVHSQELEASVTSKPKQSLSNNNYQSLESYLTNLRQFLSLSRVSTSLTPTSVYSTSGYTQNTNYTCKFTVYYCQSIAFAVILVPIPVIYTESQITFICILLPGDLIPTHAFTLHIKVDGCQIYIYRALLYLVMHLLRSSPLDLNKNAQTVDQAFLPNTQAFLFFIYGSIFQLYNS